MTQSIPASYFVSVNPSVLAAGGKGLNLSGLFLTTSTRVPIGQVMTFPDAVSVGNFFGLSSVEYAKALVYFSGFDGSNIKPGAMLFSQYPTANVAAYLHGGAIPSLAYLTGLAAGTFTVTIDGVSHTTGSIDLSGAGSFSAAAATIETALAAGGATVTYDSVTNAFVVTSGTTGSSSTITFASGGTMAAALKLDAADGAYLSQGAVAATPAAAMTAIATQTQAWATFTTTFNPDNSGNANKVLFAQWTSQQNNRYMYVAWDLDPNPTTQNPATGSLGYLVAQANDSGTACIWESSDLNHGAFLMGAVASIDFTQTQGRATMAYKGQAGLVPDVFTTAVAQSLQANGYNFYCAAATANQPFNFFYPGTVSGPFKWIDAYVNQIWLNAALQLDLMLLLTQARSIPYNSAGYAMIEQSMMDTIQSALNAGVIQPGVTLSSLQVVEVNSGAGAQIAGTLQSRGWYLQVKPADAATRANRASPPCTLWYTDGGSVQTINLASIDVQ